MDYDELIKRLQGYEWKDVEFKRSQRGVPEDAYKTGSAFSNTEGGWLVFGVQVKSTPDNLGTDQVGDHKYNMVTDQVRALEKLNETQWKIIKLCDVPRSMADIMKNLDLSHRSFFKRKYLDPLLNGDIIRMTNPDNPKASNQKYVLTEAGIKLIAHRVHTDENIKKD